MCSSFYKTTRPSPYLYSMEQPTKTPARFNAGTPRVQRLLNGFRSPFKMRLYFFKSLPSLWFWGARIRHVDPQRSEVVLPFNWASKNPFRSIYFAAQCGVAEFSTGILCKIAIDGMDERISMLVSKAECEFTKKATSDTVFYCEDGAKVIATIERAIATREPQICTMTATGKMADGTVVSVTRLTWSFLAKGKSTGK